MLCNQAIYFGIENIELVFSKKQQQKNTQSIDFVVV